MRIGINKNMLEIDILDKDFHVDEVCLQYGLQRVFLTYQEFFNVIKSQFTFHWTPFPERIKRGHGPGSSDVYLVYNNSKSGAKRIFFAKFNGNYWHLPEHPDVEICVTHFAPIPILSERDLNPLPWCEEAEDLSKSPANEPKFEELTVNNFNREESVSDKVKNDRENDFQIKPVKKEEKKEEKSKPNLNGMPHPKLMHV